MNKMAVRIGKRIAAARKAKGEKMTQQRLGDEIGVSFQAVSSWERGEYIPDAEHLPALAKTLGVTMDSLFAEKDREWKLKEINFDWQHMYTFVKTQAKARGMTQALAVQEMLRRVHGGQKRKSRYGFETEYMAHPLTMACHALAMKIYDDDVIPGGGPLFRDVREALEALLPERAKR